MTDIRTLLRFDHVDQGHPHIMFTPLHLAVHQDPDSRTHERHKGVFAAHSNVHLQTKHDRTALQVSQDEGHAGIATLIPPPHTHTLTHPHPLPLPHTDLWSSLHCSLIRKLVRSDWSGSARAFLLKRSASSRYSQPLDLDTLKEHMEKAEAAWLLTLYSSDS